MKNIAILSLFLIIFTTCSKHNLNNSSNEIEIYPRPEIKSVIDSFIITCNDKSLVYELYIDKIRNWDYDIVLYSGKRSLIENGRPIMKTTISDVNIYIYSGVEHLFSSSSLAAVSITSDSLPNEIPQGNYWLISETNGKMNIIKDATSFPFYISSRVRFEIPEANEEAITE